MKNWKSWLSGFLTAVLLSALGGTAVAATGKVMQELEYRDITVTLDGETLDLRNAVGDRVEPFMFGGTNYLPVRALAESLGLNVAWNGQTATVVLTTPSPVPEDQSAVPAVLESVDAMAGLDFEYWSAALLRQIGFTEVEVTVASGDQGVDVTAEKDEIRYAVQCKRYSSNLGNDPVQEVFAGKALYKAHVGAVITNRYFTKGARELAESNGVLLWDRDWIETQLKKLEASGIDIRFRASAPSAAAQDIPAPAETPVSEEAAMEPPAVPVSAPPSDTADVSPEPAAEEDADSAMENSDFEKPAPAAEPAVNAPSSGTASGGGSGNADNFNYWDLPENQRTTAKWVLNTSTMKIHVPSCREVKKIAPQNYQTSNYDLSSLTAQGYSACGVCKPAG